TAPDPLEPGGAAATLSETYNLYFSSTGLSADTSYYFRIAGVNKNGVTTAYTAAYGTATLLAYAPDFSGFADVGETSMRFDWSGNGNPEGTLYRVAVSTAPDPLEPGGAAFTSSDTYNVYLAASGLSPDTTYYFRVAGINRNGVATGYSAAQGSATLAGAPVSPGFSEVTDVSARLTWSAGGNPADTLYRVAVSTAPDPLNPAGARATISDTYEVFLDSAGLASDTSYYFRVAGVNKNGVTTGYIPLSTVTMASDPVFTGFTGVTSGAMRIEWSDGGFGGALYRVVVSTAHDPLAPDGAVVTSSDTYNLYLTTSGLDADTLYYSRIAGVNRMGTLTDYTAAHGTATLLAYAPGFTGFSAVGAGSIRVDWSANGNPEGTAYRLLVSLAPDPLNPGGEGVTALDTYERHSVPSGLSPNSTYYFRVAGVNKNGIPTDYTAPEATSTLANQPLFSGFTDIQSISAQFNWSSNGNPYGTLYRVLVSTAPEPSNPGGAYVTASYTYETYFSSSGLKPATDYYFTAAAVNNNGIFTGYISPQKVTTLNIVAPVFVSAGTAVGGTAGVTPAWPAHQANDVALLFVETAGGQA
ncbi:MAG TPA: hypothetical protein PL037_07340, partial [Elusimicrobiales bacterium]|nr:hypothetical protein [Elusimicrobiales bacterium]